MRFVQRDAVGLCNIIAAVVRQTRAVPAWVGVGALTDVANVVVATEDVVGVVVSTIPSKHCQ